MVKTNPVLIVLFGATGDLAQRKLYPSFFRLFRSGALAERFAVIGTARREWSDEHFRDVVSESIQSFQPTEAEKAAFLSHFYYRAHDVSDVEHYVHLKELADRLDAKYDLDQNRMYYLAMAPQFFGPIVTHLKGQQIVTDNGFNRVVIEKPFGMDYASAEQLNDQITKVFPEEDIFRIDHYLGKEMIQNILAVRLTNPFLESSWNRDYIENVQITFAEELGVEERGGYYDHSGALKDMVQNHILQVLSLLAMEPLASVSEANIQTAKIKALNDVRVYSPEEVRENFVRGQYAAGRLGDEGFVAYQEEPNVASDSRTETFVAGKFMVDNPRWNGVPFYVRTGKRLTEKGTRVNIVFKKVAFNPFDAAKEVPANDLTIYIQPTEGFALTMNRKEIGQGFNTQPIKLEYRHDSEMMENTPEAYERLTYDVILGDATNFARWEEVAQSWRIVDAIRETWDNDNEEIPKYAARTMGPKEAFDLLKKENHEWVWTPDEWYRERGLLKG